jgi:hypothetical protein
MWINCEEEHSSDAKQTIENVPYSQEEAQVEHIITMF